MKKFILTLVFNCFLISLSCQVQIGDAINGAAKLDQLGNSVSLSSNGKRAAISSISFTENQWNVQIYEEQNHFWMQVGSVIEVEVENDIRPPSISLSLDGKRFAIGNNSLYGIGQVRIYEEHDNSWIQVGENFPANAIGNFFSLSSDGKRIAIGTPFNGVDGEAIGYVSVYQENNGTWTQIGMDIEGEDPGGLFGYTVSLSSDGKRVATGGLYEEAFGFAGIYEEKNGTWTQIGMNIEGEDPDYRIGRFVALSSDGLRVAISEAEFGTGVGARIKIYEENNWTWIQIGMDIEGEALYDFFGRTFSLSGDGTRLAIGDPGDFFEPIERGYVRIYEENNGTWTQIGTDIEGENIGDYFGWSVSLSSDKTRLAIGSPDINSNGQASGQVKIFELPINTSSFAESIPNSEIKLNVSPNPSKENFYIEFGKEIKTLIVTDVNGRIIKTLPAGGATNLTISLPSVAPGVYFLHGKTKNDIIVQKLIKL